MKKILVSIKRVPDYGQKVKLKSDGSGVDESGIKWIINPFDEIALEEALRLREKIQGGAEVVVATIGPEVASEQLRTALAMGADRALHVVSECFIDSSVAAQILKTLFDKESPQFVLMGKQAIDSDANQTGQILAALLDLPQATFISKIELDESETRATVVREVDGGLETLSISLPAVITTDLRLNEPRYPSLQGIVQSKKKPLEKISLESLGEEFKAKTTIVRMMMPSGRKAGVKVESVKHLVEKLKNEAKVL